MLNKIKTPKTWFNRSLWHLVIPLVFVLIVFFFVPFRKEFQYDNDEGVNLMKAMLVDKGYSLYDEIWSDQPPLFTYALVAIFKIVGYRVAATRLFVLFLSSGLLWAAFLFMRMVWGTIHALFGILLIFMLPKYLLLSVAAMVGLPSIAFASLSMLTLGLWHRQRERAWLALSAIAMGLSILTKIFTGFLIPLFLLGITLDEFSHLGTRSSWKERLIPAFLWGLVFGLFTLCGGLILVGFGNLGQLVEGHLRATTIDIFQDTDVFTLSYHLQEARFFLLPTILGVLLSIKQKRWLSLYPVSWLATAYLLLYFHSPVWFHQQLLVTIPAGMLAAVSIGDGVLHIFRLANSRLSKDLLLHSSSFAVLVTGIFLYQMVVHPQESVALLKSAPSFPATDLHIGPIKAQYLREMSKYSTASTWVVTDMPMFAFRIGLPIPPDVAALTMKRKRTGEITDQQVLDLVAAYMPEQIFIGRLRYSSLVDTTLDENYDLHLTNGKLKLYLRKDIKR